MCCTHCIDDANDHCYDDHDKGDYDVDDDDDDGDEALWL